jgi:branched-chain amino acid transport system substrate-binding protein
MKGASVMQISRQIRAVCVVLCAALLLTAASGCAPSQPAAPPKTEPKPEPVREIKIGAIYPLSGASAATGEDCRWGIELAAEIINNKYDFNLPLAKDAGLPNLGGAKVKFIFTDHQGVPEKGMSEAERLITQEKVTAVMGTFFSSVAAPTSQVCERYKIPFLTADTTSPSLKQRDFKWFFRINPDDELISENAFQLIQSLEKEKNVSLKRIAVIHENTLWGNDVGQYMTTFAQKHGYQIVQKISYTAKSADVTSEVQKVIASKPDVLIHASYVSDAILFMKTYKQMNFAPKAFIAQGAGFYDVSYVPTLGKDGDYVFTIEFWSESLAKFKPQITKLNEIYTKKFGRSMNGASARTFMGALTLADAINRAKTTDAEAIRKALLATSIPADQVILPWEGIKIQEKDGQNPLGQVMYCQILNGKYVPVWPFHLKTQDLVYPFPAWNKRN